MKFTVQPRTRKSSIVASSKRYVRAAEEDEDFGYNFDDENEDNIQDTLDDVQDSVDDMQDAVEDVEEDAVNIDTDNNISNHYIVECEMCHGIFISAMTESEQEVSEISGVCPLCEEDTTQRIKWVIHDVETESAETE